jgi:hypothetical protein
MSRLLKFLNLLVLVLLHLGLQIVIAQTCYNPNGSIASGDIPAVSGSETFCCPQGSESILSPGPVCRSKDSSGNYTFVRGSCTAQSWESNACPRYCIGKDGKNSYTLHTTHYTLHNFITCYMALIARCSRSTSLFFPQSV